MRPVGLYTHTFTCGEKDTDTDSPGAWHTGLLRTVYMFALPRVHAADIVDPEASLHSLPKHVGKPEFPDTGWDRIKDLFEQRFGFLWFYVCFWILECIKLNSSSEALA